MGIMKRSEVVSEVYGHHGEFFAVTFVKRTTGEMRTMQCRQGVKKHLAGGPAAYNPHEHNLLFVFDMTKMAYKSIPVEGILQIAIGGKSYEVVD